MTFTITVYGVDHTTLTDREKERLAQTVHDVLVENHGVRPETVDVEGYMEGAP